MKLECLVLMYFSCKIYQISGSDIVMEIWIYVREKSGKCQEILINSKCMNPDLVE